MTTKTTRTNEPIVAVLNDWGTVSSEVEHAGATALQIGTRSEFERALPYLDGIVLTGGGDVNPYAYAKERHKKVYGVDNTRDNLEFFAIRMARKRRIPMFGICRGMQILNVAHGGTLQQHIFDSAATLGHEGTEHEVVLRRKTKVADYLGVLALDGHSIHHQAVDRMGNGLLPVGWSHDGIVEMLESAPGVRPYVLATQFHPEMAQFHEDANRIIECFIDYLKQRVHRWTMPFWERWAEVEDLLPYHTRSSRSVITIGGQRGDYGYGYGHGGRGYYGYHGGFEGDTMFEEDWEEFDDYRTARYRRGSHDSTLAIVDKEMDRRMREHWSDDSPLDTKEIEEIDSVCLGGRCPAPSECLGYGDCAMVAVQAQQNKRGNPRIGGASK